MGTRPRIGIVDRGDVVLDKEAFVKNKCSDLAKQVHTHPESVEFDVWFDKHYFIREQHGDEDGKRDGIDFELVKELINSAAKHLIFYSIKVRPFSFVNFTQEIRCDRVVLTQLFDGELDLNVIAEYHYLSLNKYEVTIKTALRKDAFSFSDGQFQIQIEPDGCSRLYKKERGQVKMISEFIV